MQRSYNMTNVTSIQYGINQYSGIAGTCANPITTDFQTKYFSAFQKTTNFVHNYVITGSDTNQILTLTTSAGDTLVFGTKKALGLSEVESRTFSVYPNPVKDVINIVGASDNKPSSVAIYDLTGKLVLSDIAGQKVNASFLKKGVYMMQISFGSKSETIKVIKE